METNRSTPPIRTVIVDPYPLSRYGLMALVRAQPEFVIVRAVATPTSLARNPEADLALVHQAPDAPPPPIGIPWVLVRLTDAPHRIIASARQVAGVRTSRIPVIAKTLSRRELEVVGLVASGYTDIEIADALYISVRTVRSHLDRIRAKIGQRRRAELTRWYLDRPAEPTDSA